MRVGCGTRGSDDSDEFQQLLISAWEAMVRPSGVEPPLLSEHGPEPCASANSATGAFRAAREIGPRPGDVNRPRGSRQGHPDWGAVMRRLPNLSSFDNPL